MIAAAAIAAGWGVAERALPGEGARHRGLAHGGELAARAVGVDGPVDGAEKSAERGVLEQEAGDAVLDRVGEPAGLVGDRQRAEALRIHLAEPQGSKRDGMSRKSLPAYMRRACPPRSRS